MVGSLRSGSKGPSPKISSSISRDNFSRSAKLRGTASLLMELRPAALEEAKLDCLLRQLAEAVTGRARLAVALSIAAPPPLPRDVRVALYRIAQEALNNVARHARASKIDLGLRALPRGVELRVAEAERGVFATERLSFYVCGIPTDAVAGGGSVARASGSAFSG